MICRCGKEIARTRDGGYGHLSPTPWRPPHVPRPTQTPSERAALRFWAKVDATGDCWEWTGARGANGYGDYRFPGLGTRYSHRIAYALLVGPVPDGLQLDHLCRNRICVNPDHLEPVTNRENWIRGHAPSARIYRSGSCAKGHAFTPENTLSLVGHPTERRCRTCHREEMRRRGPKRAEYMRRFRERRRAATP